MQGPLRCSLTCRFLLGVLRRFGGTSLVSVMERSPWISEVDTPERKTLLAGELVRRLRQEVEG